jgi:hypothetical protein
VGRVKGTTTTPWALHPIVLVAMALAVSLPGTAGAQEAEVVPPDRQGDFGRLEWLGPRGPIRQRHWLVVDPDPAGLICRDGAGRATIALRPGAIVATDPAPPTPLRLVQGRPWLRVTAPALAILRDSRSEGRGQPVHCWVRANRLFLAPILPEFLPRPDRKTP